MGDQKSQNDSEKNKNQDIENMIERIEQTKNQGEQVQFDEPACICGVDHSIESNGIHMEAKANTFQGEPANLSTIVRRAVKPLQLTGVQIRNNQ